MRGNVSLMFVLFFLVGNVFSQETNQTLVWKISGNDLSGKSYIVGTMPIQDSTFYQYPSKTFKLLAKTDAFASFDNKDLTTNATTVREKSFKDFPKNYAIYPSQYFEVLATQELKPTVELSNSLSYQELYKTAQPSNINSEEVRENFLTGNITALLQNRLAMDLNNSIFSSLQNDYNYLLTEQLVQQMRAQSLFFPVDIAYLEGQNGLINLLKARGYKVTPMYEREFKKKAKVIEKKKQILQQIQLQDPSNPQTNTVNQNVQSKPIQQQISGLENLKKTEDIPIKLPIGIINLKNWGNYSLLEDKIKYSSPNRLKNVSEYEDSFETISNDLTYSIKLVSKFKNKKEAIEKLVIDNGGQLTYAENTTFQGYDALKVELIYSENLLSKHIIIDYPARTIIASVKGETPQIFSKEAEHFFNNISLEQIDVTETVGLNPNNNTPEVIPWVPYKVNEMNLNLPVTPKDVSTTLANGKKLTSFVIPRGEVDDNLYLISALDKDPIPLFKMFNEAINTATEQSRAVVVDRNILPADKQYYSHYLLKDAVDNYYSIDYYYLNGKFYQVIIKGSKKTIANTNAKNILQSIYFPSALPPITN